VPKESYRIPVKPEHMKFVRDAMVDVNISGTGRVAFQGAPYKVGGKTGTAQVIGIKQGEKYNEARVAERHRDHSLFIAFAPAEDPKIAIAVLVENGGFGARAAAPVARAAIDYYLLGKKPAGPAVNDDGDDDERSAAHRGRRAGDIDPEHAMTQASIARRVGMMVRPYVTVFDPALLAIVGCLGVIGLVTLYSAGNDFPWRVTTSCATLASHLPSCS